MIERITTRSEQINTHRAIEAEGERSPAQVTWESLRSESHATAKQCIAAGRRAMNRGQPEMATVQFALARRCLINVDRCREQMRRGEK